MPKLPDQLTELATQGANDQALRAAAANHHENSWRRRAAHTIQKREEELLLSGNPSANTVYSNPQLPSGRVENSLKWKKMQANIAAKKVAGLPVTPDDIE